MDLHTSLPFVSIIFMLCCGFVHCDTEDATENVESVMTHAPIVSDSPVGQYQTTVGGGEYTDYQEDDNMYLFGDYFNKQDTDDNQNAAQADDRSATQSFNVADSHTISNNVVQVTESPNFIEDSEEAYDLGAYDKDYGTEATQMEANEGSRVAEGAQSDGAGGDSTETSGSGSSSSSGETKQFGGGDSNNGNSKNSDSKSSSENSGSSSSGTDDNGSGGNGKDDGNDIVDVETYHNLQGSASSEDSSYSDESSGESGTKKKNCKCKKNKNGKGGDFGSDDSSDDSSEDQSSSSGSGSGNRDKDKSREGNYGDQGDSSSDESNYDSYDSEDHESSSESREEPDKPDIPDYDKQRTGNGLDRNRNEYTTSIHRFFTSKTNTLFNVVNKLTSNTPNTPSSPGGGDVSLRTNYRLSYQPKSTPSTTTAKSYIINLTTTPPPLGGDPPNVKDITDQSVPKWFRDYIPKREYVEQPIARDYILTPRTSFWEPPDVAKPPDWQEQKEWINIKINLEKPADWIDDPNSNGSIPHWNIPYIPPDWFKKNNEKLTTEFHFELTTPSPKTVRWTPKPEGVDRTTHVPEYLAKKRVCDRKFDIVLAIDGTGNEKDFGYLKGAIVQLLDRLIMGEDKVKVGVVLLGNTDGLQIPISGNRVELEDQVARLGLPEDSNRYDIALKSAGELLEREGREGIPKVAIMIVNGKSRYQYHTRMEAARLHRSGISVFTVGVGYNTDEEELKTISSSQNEVIRVKNYIHLVYLMTGYVQLFCNVEDNYLTPPTLAPPHQTATPKAKIIAKLTTDVMSEPSPREAKVLCEGCKMINGAGFNSHPNECDLFVHCYFGELGLRAIIRKCPFGQFWNQTILSCEYSERAYCPMDRCAYIKDRDYEASENCRAYWECSNGHSRGKCCRYGYRYVRGEGCVLDSDNICKESCPMEMPTDLHSYNNAPAQSCDKIPIANDRSHYQQLLPGTGYVTMPCAEGTHYNERKCTCTDQEPSYPTFKEPLVQEPPAGCRPEVKLDFKNGVTDSSGKWTYVNNQGVLIQNGEAIFNGDSRLLIPRFTNVEFGKTFVIRLRYKEEEKLKFNESQALVNNGDCGDFGSIQIFTKRNSIGYVVKTTKEPSHVSLQIHKPHGEWKDVEYVVSDGKFEGYLNGVQATKWSMGSVESRQCAVQIGFGHGYNNFRGRLSLLEIYLCKPEKAMKYS